VATMDIPMPAGSDEFKKIKNDTEDSVFGRLFQDLPDNLVNIHREFQLAESEEARLVHGLDKVQMMIKVLCYQRENRGNLEEFWQHQANFNDYGIDIVARLFQSIAEAKRVSDGSLHI